MTTQIYLQRMLDALAPNTLPTSWHGFELAAFSKDKTLWDYQQDALTNALKALHLYYKDPTLSLDERKKAFFKRYQDFGLEENLDLPLQSGSAAKRQVAALQTEYYQVEDDKLPYWQFVNNMAFWMATGSGKTLVIVKLLGLLHELIRRDEIPERDILILAHRDDLLDQIQQHVNEFNLTSPVYLRLYELRDYAEVKRARPNLFAADERTIFYYRSDNLSDEQKEKIIDFRNYDNHGRWYILLDEAHKGDREDSKRQQLFAILSRQGFLFNFSATFTDPRDIVCTAYNFNLSEYIRRGYGKHIHIFEGETTAFKKSKKDFTRNQKQAIVLKGLMMLAVVRQAADGVRAVHAQLYHRPLMMTLVNSVNTKDADLKLFFRELVRIAGGEIEVDQWQTAREELLTELAARPSFVYEGTRVKVDLALLRTLTPESLLRRVFNSGQFGGIEVLFRPSNRQEAAFKMKTSDLPFALVRIGDISNWFKKELSGYEVNHHFNDETFFEKLNQKDSSINLLLGSRTFYEGWDSNRPNVIMYINIGTSRDARKFILQSVGRGVRIEPLPDQRKRFPELRASGGLSESERLIFEQVRDCIQPLESEFIFGTNREALRAVIEELKKEDTQTDSEIIPLRRNDPAVGDQPLLVPVYREETEPIYTQRIQAKFSLSKGNLDQLKRYLDYIPDDRVLIALHRARPAQVRALRESLQSPQDHYRTDEGIEYKNLTVLMRQAVRFMSLYGKDFERFKSLDDEINHFERVLVRLPKVKFAQFEKKLLAFYDQPEKVSQLKEKLEANQITLDEYTRQILNTGSDAPTFSYEGQTVSFRRIQQHYYLPLLVSADDKLDYLRSVIQVPSEVHFLDKLEEYLKDDEGNLFNTFDWWCFSRIDENADQVNIPYYYPYENRIANFKPDFIFWLRKGNDYHILFVDPKGTSRTEYQHKVDGFRKLFERDGHPIRFEHEGLNVRVHLFLYTQDKAFVADYYRRYWLDTISGMVEVLSSNRS